MATQFGKKALCVGINKFKHFPHFALNGCVNDAKDMGAVLKELMGFRAADIMTLTDANATKANIMARLKSMVADAKAGKINHIVFSFSSHGTQTTDLDGDEPEGMDEAFVPFDIAQKGNDWDPARIISDDEFHDLFDTLPDDCLLEAYLDTCHSGTGFRALGMRPRYIPPPTESPVGKSAKVRGFSLKPKTTRKGKASRKNAAPDVDTKAKATKNIILWTGCRSNQTSADAFFDGRYNGAFTYNYVKVMRGSGGALSRNQVLEGMKKLMAGHFDQIPQLEADATNRNANPTET
jgi:hypothetical protein